MTCRCTVTTLNLFIRNVAQFDLPSSSRCAPRQLQKTSIRSLATARAFRGQQSRSRRAYSSNPSKDGISFKQPTASEARKSEPELQNGDREHNGAQSRPSKTDSENAFVDFSLDAIDAIASESETESLPNAVNRVPEYDTPLKSLLKDIPKKKDQSSREQVSRTTFRRTRTENTSFTLHFSAPRKTPDGGGRAVRSDLDANPKHSNSKEPTKRPTPDDWTPPRREQWMIEKDKVREKYPDGYNPLKRLSPDAMAGIRALHAQMPEQYTTWALSQQFEVSPEAIRRILKSQWTPSPEEQTDRERRWFKRGEAVWSRYAELGVKPPRKWRDQGIGRGKPDWMLKKQEKAPLPALVTTARRNEQKHQSGNEADSISLADKIL